MIKINNVELDVESINVQIGKFEKNSYTNGQKINEIGLAPIFIIKTNSDIIIRIETNYNIDNLKLIESEIDITKNITDISYEDKNGWITLIDSDFKVEIKRIGNDFNIIMYLNSVELESMIINLQVTFKF